MTICPTVQYIDFMDGGTATRYDIQVGAKFLGWNNGGIGKWGFFVYGRANGAPLDHTTWTVHRSEPNRFITMPDDAVFLGVAMTGDFLFLSMRAK